MLSIGAVALVIGGLVGAGLVLYLIIVLMNAVSEVSPSVYEKLITFL